MNSFSFSIKKIVFISTFLFSIIPINKAQKVDPGYGYGIETDFYLVTTIPLIFSVISFLGTLYIFFRMFLRWKRSKRSIPLSFKFPFYIAITDFLYSSAILIEFAYTASNKTDFVKNNETNTWPYLFCEILGFLIVFFVLLNIILVGAISIVTWLRVVREYYFEFGKYDYKIWLPIIFISLIIPLSTLNAYGSRGYSCGTKIGSDLVGIVVFVLIVVTLLTIIFCYVHVLKTIRDIQGHIPNSSIEAVRNSNVERRTFKKVLTYILVFILQYIPILIYNISMILRARHIIFDALSPAVICIGGIANVFQYLRNEGLKFSHTSSNNSSSYKLEVEERSDDTTQDA
ncbi:unnamed protein product [Rhizophagus irregularis]|uniref:G-protein coupled receptors family 1 profile domain-containing protein n=1 Tax=Rhizophagus irregularis TaxID=588596 RepID=A0A2N1MKW1_9GLOM|nr:hypothetical protein RhiirC2_790619 [Rhizophagus irregularis]CAB4397172.1 unnamed protein product [Rhizophagus irregularis]CAB5365831.1 unnamed protein product [Rhizophagus irregularis]